MFRKLADVEVHLAYNIIMKNTSYVKLNSKIVCKLATDMILRIDASRKKLKAEDQQNRIEKKRQEIMSNWWHRLWRSPAPSMKKILEEIDIDMNKRFTHPYVFIDCLYSKQEQVARTLINACKYTDEICVSTEDLFSLR